MISGKLLNLSDLTFLISNVGIVTAAQVVRTACKMLGTEWAQGRSLAVCPGLAPALCLMEGGRDHLWLCFCLCYLILFIQSLLIIF